MNLTRLDSAILESLAPVFSAKKSVALSKDRVVQVLSTGHREVMRGSYSPRSLGFLNLEFCIFEVPFWTPRGTALLLGESLEGFVHGPALSYGFNRIGSTESNWGAHADSYEVINEDGTKAVRIYTVKSHNLKQGEARLAPLYSDILPPCSKGSTRLTESWSQVYLFRSLL